MQAQGAPGIVPGAHHEPRTRVSLSLSDSRYGRSGIRLLKLTRRGDRHEVHDLVVDVALEGDFLATHEAGDNRGILPTDSMQNAVLALSRDHADGEVEEFGLELVSDEPWAAFNYYLGGRRSRIVVNTGTATTLTAVAAPGHLLGVSIASGLIVTAVASLAQLHDPAAGEVPDLDRVAAVPALAEVDRVDPPVVQGDDARVTGGAAVVADGDHGGGRLVADRGVVARRGKVVPGREPHDERGDQLLHAALPARAPLAVVRAIDIFAATWDLQTVDSIMRQQGCRTGAVCVCDDRHITVGGAISAV